MARPGKRKRATSARGGVSEDEPPTKRGKTTVGPEQSLSSQNQHAVLNQFYPQVSTLRNYVLSKLPSSSRIRRKKVTAVGARGKSLDTSLSDVECSLGALLDTTLVGIPENPKDDGDSRVEGWRNFSSQKGDESYVTLSNGIAGFAESQSLIVEYVIRTLFSREKSLKWPKHLLCDGFRRDRGLGLRAIRPNPHVETLQHAPWPQLLALLGEAGDRIMIDLLLDCAIFVSVAAGVNNFCQISGQPLSNVDPVRPETTGDVQLAQDVKSPSELVFVRNRMLYARAALNARGLVHFGLRHIHVLNRSPYNHLDEDPELSIEKQEQTVRRNGINTLRVTMYMFPRQFRLHNVFTSKVDLKETSQRLKDYTLREDEINEKFGRLGDADVRVRIPKRLRGNVSDLVQKLQILHQRCSYSKLLQHHCPVQYSLDRQESRPVAVDAPRKSSRKSRTPHKKSTQQSQKQVAVSQRAQTSSVVELATSPASVSAFCRAVLKKVVPRGFWGSDSVADHNESLFLAKVDRFISLRRFEGMSLHEVAQGMKFTDINWLAPPLLMAKKTSKTDAQKRLELFNEFLYFLFDSVVIPLIRSNFYVTESNTDKYRLFFFRHDSWRSLVEPAMATLKGIMFEEVNQVDARRILDSRLLGFSQVRLLPKGINMRPIMNLRRRAALRGKPKELGLGINKVLAPAHTVLQLEKIMHPERLGSTMFSVGDIYKRIKPFKSRMGPGLPKFYFAKLDVQSAFDTIPQAAIVGLLDSIPQQRQYRVAKYLEVTPNLASQGNGAHSKSKPLKKWPSAAISKDDTSTFLQQLESGRATTKRNTVFVDLWKQQYETSELLQLVASHIQQNLVKIGKKFYRQKKGIPQGSVLSSTLCNYFYADLEIHVLPFVDSGDCLLLRLIDDFLLITTDRSKAVRFVEVMHRGVPEYGVTISSQKSLVNFDLEIEGNKIPKLENGKGFPYCGTVIDCKTLDIGRAQNKEKATAIYNSLTVEYTRAPGRTFQRKVLNAFKIQSHLMYFDTGVNSVLTMLTNVHNAFTETATKMWAYARCLPAPKQPSAKMVNSTISKLSEVAYLLLISTARKLRYPGYVCDVKKCEVSWLAYTAFHKVLTQKQARYGDTLGWLKVEMWKLSLLKDIRHGRVHHVK
ncbi:Uu.00g045030.m01.CDS01 [Anthostomella pinea]|uniref:Telomerase reverse transcriptase n=1 Tax=Anthostomella pinea TaxID=933095 RepID=A0AAI8VB39_9PEZI|nr:Uu.00g045030.m01.CDS01 [Anthostomella pinea]